MLPQWQQKVLEETSAEKKTIKEDGDFRRTLSIPVSTSSESLSKSDSEAPQPHPWQSAVGSYESTNSDEAIKQDSSQAGEQAAQGNKPMVMLLEDSEVLPPVSKAGSNVGDVAIAQQEPSLSPSSLVLDPYLGLTDVRVPCRGTRVSAAQGPSQPEMSQDLFQPSVTQENPQDVCTVEGQGHSGVYSVQGVTVFNRTIYNNTIHCKN